MLGKCAIVLSSACEITDMQHNRWRVGGCNSLLIWSIILHAKMELVMKKNVTSQWNILPKRRARGYHTSNLQTSHESYAGLEVSSHSMKVKAKTDQAFGVRCCTANYFYQRAESTSMLITVYQIFWLNIFLLWNIH